MDPSRYETVKKIVLAARELPPADRDAYLAEVCGDDRELLGEAASLLAEADAPARIVAAALPTADEESLASLLGDAAGEPGPERVGPYEILEVLGEGGMGVVYRARQTAPIEREVALKLIKRGMDTDQLVARFENERQTLARMDHPGVARILDAGADDRGRPYFVMELASGQHIDAYCDERKLPTKDRLELFLKVCDAVQHAHQRGVIHRDLKPSNLLVTVTDGVATAKIIDFGIARLVEPDPESTLLTHAGQFIGTPDYMSPEQAGLVDGGVDTRTDVYALGVILYELLTGHRPYRFDTFEFDAIRRVISDTQPLRPSLMVSKTEVLRRGRADRRLTPELICAARGESIQALRRQLRGDLDNIVLMALRKEVDRRYASVEQMARDIRFHMRNLPVTACPDTWSYRTGKFLRRHTVGVAVATLVLALSIGFGVVMAVQSARLAEQRDEAREGWETALEQLTTATEVRDFLIGLFESANPSQSRGEAITARELLDRGADDIRTKLRDQPKVRSKLLSALGEVYFSLGLYDRARALLLDGLETASSLEAEDADPRVAEILSRLATVFHDQGDYDRAIELGRQGLDLRVRLELDDTADYALQLNYLASAYQAKGDLDAAEPLYRESLELLRRIHGDENADVAYAMNTLGWLHHARGELEAAEPLYRKALDIQRRVLGGAHPDAAGTLNNLAGLYGANGDDEQALAAAEEALSMYRQLYGEDHAAVARAYHAVAMRRRAGGDLEGAEPLFRRALEINEKLFREHRYVAISLQSLGVVLMDLGKPAEAEGLLTRALAMQQKLLPEGHPQIEATRRALETLQAGAGSGR